MPLDGTNYKIKIAPLQTGLAGLKQLGDALRMSLPRSMFWDFGVNEVHIDCGTYGCAMLVAHILWPTKVHGPHFGYLHGALRLPTADLYPLFGGTGMHDSGIYGGKTHDQITFNVSSGPNSAASFPA